MVAAPSATSDGARATVQRISSGAGAAQEVKTAEKTARRGTAKAEAPGPKLGVGRVQVTGAGAGASPNADKDAETIASPQATSGEDLTKLPDTFTVGGTGGSPA